MTRILKTKDSRLPASALNRLVHGLSTERQDVAETPTAPWEFAQLPSCTWSDLTVPVVAAALAALADSAGGGNGSAGLSYNSAAALVER